MIDSELEANEQGQLGRLQKRTIRRYVYPRLIFISIVVGLAVAVCILARVTTLICYVSMIPMLYFYSVFLFPDLGQASNLLRDTRDGEVIEDCGVITYHYARPAKGFGKSFVLVDNERTYWWHKRLSGGFESGKRGCIYFLPRTRLVVSVEIMPDDENLA